MNYSQIITFIGHHWLLVALLLILLILIVGYDQLLGQLGKVQISAKEAVELINRHDAVVIDVRSIQAFQGGHIINAIHIPLNKLVDKLPTLADYKDKPIILVGSQNQKLTKMIDAICKQLSEDVKIVARGMEAWKGAGFPIVKEKL